MRNLLNETIEILAQHNKTLDEVRWIGGDDFIISLYDFKRLADVEYDDDYGAQKIATDLKIVGNNWWMERAEYDGAEWWEFKTMPNAPMQYCTYPKSLVSYKVGWDSLDDIQNYDSIL